MKLGMITIGQSPRKDVVPEMKKFLPEDTIIIEKGALDGLSKEEIELMKPKDKDYVLVSKLSDNTNVTFAKRYIIPRIKESILELEVEKVDLILIICTGKFEEKFESKIPILYPDEIILGVVPSFLSGMRLAVITPEKKQIEQTRKKWEKIDKDVIVEYASPYEDINQLKQASMKIKGKSDLVVLDCIGYTADMKEYVKKITDSFVICSKTLVARSIGEILS